MRSPTAPTRQLLILAIIVLSTGCSVTPSTKPTYKTGTDIPTHSISWIIENNFDLTLGPTSTVFVQINGTSTQILANSGVEFSETPSRDWESQGIPKNAKFALQGWWAGYGEAIYALHNIDHLEIHWRKVIEGESPSEYELIKIMPLN